MKTNWDFALYKVVLLFFTGMIIGGAIVLLITNNTNVIGAILQIVAMILVSIAVLISCRKKVENQ